MSSRRHARARELFLQALDRAPDARAAYLDEACGGDDDLRAEVDSLLAFHEEESDPLPATLSEPGGEPVSEDRIPGYRLIRSIGEGGMGEVWEAEQQEPVLRRVAVKVIKAGMDSRQIVSRFEAERQTLAMMDHPNIASLFDAGTTDRGRPFFAMEFIEGEPLTSYCDRYRLNPRERLDLFLRVCEGVQHAHTKGIIHRDLKPSNVLVRMVDERPVPTIIDFGIAKATGRGLAGRTMQTALGMMIGTPEYMSPEQADLAGRDVDTRSDVYSLGVMLYELLVGAMPFDLVDADAVSLDAVLRKIREDEPSRPSTRISTLGETGPETARQRRTDLTGLRRLLRGDLDWITMRALEKDRVRRYPSPADLAADIGRYLRHEPVLAGPPGVLYRLRKFSRRHRVAVAAGLMVVAVLVLGVVGTAVGFIRAREEAESARRVAGILEQMLNDFNPGTQQGHASNADELLDRTIERINSELQGEPLVQARLLRVLGRSSYWLGFNERARTALGRSVEILRDEYGNDNLEVAQGMRMVADLLNQAGDYDEAIRVQEEGLEIRRRIQDPESQEIGYGLAHLGHLYWRKGEFQRARDYFEQALPILEMVEGLREVDTGTALVSFSLLESDEGDYAAARAHLERALELKHRHLGDGHPEVGMILHELGRAHLNSGDLVEARKYLEQGREVLSAALGEDHLNLSYSHNHLGNLLAQEGEYDAAREHLDRSLQIRETILGPDHPDVAWSLQSRALLAIRTGDLFSARKDVERGMKIVESAFGPDHVEIVRWQKVLSRLENAAGNEEIDR